MQITSLMYKSINHNVDIQWHELIKPITSYLSFYAELPSRLPQNTAPYDGDF